MKLKWHSRGHGEMAVVVGKFRRLWPGLDFSDAEMVIVLTVDREERIWSFGDGVCGGSEMMLPV